MLGREFRLQGCDRLGIAATCRRTRILQLLHQRLHLLELGHELTLSGRCRHRGLLGCQLHHGGVLGESQGGKCVLEELHFRADGAEEVCACLEHGVLEVLAEEERVAPGNRHTRLELLLLDSLRHLHEELRHLGQRQVDLLTLVLQLLGFLLIAVGALVFVLEGAVFEVNLLVIREDDITSGLCSGKIAHIHATTLLSVRLGVRNFHFKHHDAVTACGHGVELRWRNGLAAVANLEYLPKVVPALNHLGLTPLHIHESVRIFAHARFVGLLLARCGHEISDSIHNILEVLHADLPAILLLREDIICQSWEEAPHIMRL